MNAVNSGLTDRERAVFPLLAHGFTRDQIAGELDLRIQTTRTTIQRLYDKLGARNLADAVRIGYQLNILPRCGKRCQYCERAAQLPR